MRVKALHAKNILCFRELSVEVGSVTEISGGNGTGKSSFLELIRAALGEGTGKDATLLYRDPETGVVAENGEIVLVFDDGVMVAKEIESDGKSRTRVKDPQYGFLSKPAAYIKDALDSLGCNPIEFLTAAPKDRAKILLEAIPMKLNIDKLNGCVLSKYQQSADVVGKLHPLVVIEQVRKQVFDDRTGLNRVHKEKRAAAEQNRAALPAAPTGSDWDVEIATREAMLENIAKDENLRISQAQASENQQLETVRLETWNRVAELEKQIREATAEGDARIGAVCNEIRQEIESIKRECASDREPVKDGLVTARAMRDLHIKAAGARELVKQLEQEADQAEGSAAMLSASLASLDKLKGSLLEGLPIAGLEVKDGEIFVDGIVFDRVPESRRIQIAMEIARLRAGKLPLIVVDGLEALEPKNFDLFVKHARELAEKEGVQFIVTRVAATDELSIKAEA